MKVCYIGPYKYNNWFGTVSRDIIDQLANSNVELTTKHVFINNPYDNSTLVEYSNYEENLRSDIKYDLVIEHAPVHMLHIDRNIADKYVCMPIFDYSINNSWKYILKQFDKVITDDVVHFENMKEANIDAELIRYTIEKINNPQHVMNLSYHNHRRKFYFVGNYLSNQNIINKIIVSFILTYRASQDFSLLLFFNDENRENAEKVLSQSMDDLLGKLNYHEIISPIKYIIQPIGIEQLHIIHNSCDVFIDLYDDYETGLNRYLALEYNRPIIDITNTDFISVPSVDLIDFSISKNKKSILSDALIKTFNNMRNKNTRYQTKYPSKLIKEILCI